MNIAIVVGVSQYVEKGANLPACKKDADCMSTVLQTAGKFDDILVVSEKTISTNVKEKLVEFITANKTNEIQEVFFYFSGHGEFIGNEFYYLFSDFENNRRKQTALENSELDNLLRTLDPKLAIKVVDACQSGVPYVKDLDAFGRYLKGTQKTFKDCYFLYSSLTEQASYQDENLSEFTQCFAEAIVNHKGSVIRYKDIIDYISDRFEKDPDQTPFFVVQADFTDPFCRVVDSMREAVGKRLDVSIESDGTQDSSKASVALVELVKQEAKDYCTGEEIAEALGKLPDKIEDIQAHPGALDLFEVEVEKGIGYEGICDTSSIARWLNENENKYFAKPILKKRIIEVPDYLETLTVVPHGQELRGRKQVVQVPVGVRPTIEMPFEYMIIRGKTRFPNLNSVAWVLVPIVSQTHVRFFSAFSAYSNIGSDKKIIDKSVKWRTVQVLLKDETAITEYLRATFTDFWEFALEPIKSRFGLLPSQEANAHDDPKGKQEDGGAD